MSRLERFARNAGWGGVLRTVLVAGILVYGAVTQSKQVPWMLVVATAGAAFLAMYPFRGAMVRNLTAMTWILSASMVAAVAVGFTMVQRNANFVGLSVYLGAFLGAYLGCYFWLMSDPRIGRVEE